MIDIGEGVHLLLDGSIACSTVEHAVKIKRSLPNGVSVGVVESSADLKKYNALVAPEKRIKVVDPSTSAPKIQWVIPDEYKELDIWQFLVNKLVNDDIVQWDTMSELEQHARLKRLDIEFKEFKSRNMLNLLRCLIHVIDTLASNDVCWGVGRGSSVSSYLLYVLEVHDVDSFKFKLPLSEFFR